jgi:choline dehydrogenase-like flavoprotein
LGEVKYDIVIIGSGAGGGTLAHALASTGKKILILERGDFLPREKENWEPKAVFLKNRYHTTEKWQDKEGAPFTPGMNYYVGGNTKVYGAALLRLRENDFKEVKHYGGISPAWPLSYQDFQPYYLQAEKLYSVHGLRGEDPVEPPESAPYFFPPISHEPYIQSFHDKLKEKGLHPFHLPLGLMLDEKNPEKSRCIRCDTCDGFPCLVQAKADAHVTCIEPALSHSNVTLMTNTEALRLIPDATGERISFVEVKQAGQGKRIEADLFICSCGAINSAALMLRSRDKTHPNGLGNNNDLVGRHYMFHHNSVMIAISKTKNPTRYEKTLAINDFYYKADDSSLPLGHIQLLGNVKPEMLAAEAPVYAPGFALDFLADHAVGWWLTTEDLPDPNNRVRLTPHDQIVIEYTPNNLTAHQKLLEKLKKLLNHLGPYSHLFPSSVYLSQQIPIAGCAHQAGTLCFGKDPQTSVLDLNCKMHGLKNLYVVDSSFFPSIGAVNPTLTIIANALRVAEIIKSSFS